MRNVAIALAALLALTVYGCGKKEETAQAPAAPAAEQTTAPAEQAPATTAPVEQAPAADQAPAVTESK